MPWVVATWALAFAFLPNYAGHLWGGSPQATSPAGSSTSRLAQRTRWTLSIAGMTCEGCAAHIEAELAKVPGVLSVSVSYKSGRAVVEADPSVTEEVLRKAVEEAGYTVESAAKSSGG